MGVDKKMDQITFHKKIDYFVKKSILVSTLHECASLSLSLLFLPTKHRKPTTRHEPEDHGQAHFGTKARIFTVGKNQGSNQPV